MSVINNRSLGRFWPISWTITYFRGSRSDLHDLRTTWCVYVSVINNHSLADSGPFLGLLLSFGVPE